MRLVIDIPQNIYNHTQDYELGGFSAESQATLFMAIKNGTPLPKTNKGVIEALFGAMSASTIIERIPNQHWLNGEFEIGG